MMNRVPAAASAALFALYPVLYLFASNQSQTSGAVALPPILLMIVIALGWYQWGKQSLGDAHRGALISSLIASLFGIYGHIHAVIHKKLLKVDFQMEFPLLGKRWFLETSLHLALSLLALALIAFAARKLRRPQADWKEANQKLTVVAALLCFMPLAQIGTGLLNQPQDPAQAILGDPAWGKAPSVTSHERRAENQPDIYYIVLDGYARADTLKDHYGFDNSGFLEGLKDRGFEIADKSHANFYYTFMSLSSTLNLDYINRITDIEGPKSRNRDKLYRILRDNRAARFLKAQGYDFVHFRSTWGATSVNPYADVAISCDQGVLTEEFNRVFVESTWLRLLSSSMGADLASCWKSHFNRLREIPAERIQGGAPRFVFAHFVPPHHPYLFDREGKVLRDAHVFNQFEFQKNLWADRKSYVDQLDYMNREMLGIIDAIQKTSKVPPVIILASDHGSHVNTGDKHQGHILRVRNLMTLSLPGKSKPVLYDTVTPVNVFRLVFNELFDAKLPLLPDRSYFSGYNTPYQFKLISEVSAPEIAK